MNSIQNLKQKNMYKKSNYTKTTIKTNQSYQGERIEEKIQRIVNNKEPISDNAPLVYTERKDGVRAEHDIRTDRWEVAVEAMDTVTKSMRAKREGKPKTMGEEAIEGMKKEGLKDQPGDSGAKSTQGTE